MMNNFMIIGRLYKFVKEDENNVIAIIKTKKVDILEEYEIDIIMSGSIKENTMKYCSSGDILGVKGYIFENNKLIADKVTFLSSKKEEE